MWSRTAPLALFVLALSSSLLCGCQDESFPRLTPLSYDASHPIRISADGTQLVTATGSMLHNLDVSGLNPGKGGRAMSWGASATTYFRLEIADVAISNDGTWIAAGGHRSIHVSGGTVTTPHGSSGGGIVSDLEPDGMIWTLAFSPDKRWLASSVGVYDTSTWELAYRFAPPAHPRPKAVADPPGAVPAPPVPDASASATAQPAPPTGSAAEEAAPPTGSAAPETALPATSAEPAAPPAALASAPATPAAPEAGSPPAVPPEPAEPPKSATLFGSADQVTLVRFSPDGKTLYVIGNDKVVLLNPATWSVVAEHAFTFQGGMNPAIDLTPTGLLAIAGRSAAEVKLFEVTAKGLVPRPALRFEGQLLALAFDAQGKRLAVAGRTRLAIYHPGQTDKPSVRPLPRQNPEVVHLAWHPHGKAIFAARADNAVEMHKVR